MNATADAIVVLGCAVRGGQASAALVRRAALAVHAVRSGAGGLLIASGGRCWDGAVEALVIRDLLWRELGPVEVQLELCSLTTVQNAWYSARLMRARGLRRAMLATCPWHLPRALVAFRRCGIDAVAPPPAWHDDAGAGPRATASMPAAAPATWIIRARERACGWIDAATLALLRESK